MLLRVYVPVLVDTLCCLAFAWPYIEHRTTQVRSPRNTGFVERMNRTLLAEFFRVAGRTTCYEQVNQIQADLDRFVAYYNLDRSHQGYRLRGRTPAQALREALGRHEFPSLNYQLTQEDSTDQTEAA